MLTNLNRGGVKRALSDSSFDDVNPYTYTCGRLFARTMQKVAFVVSICFLLGACENSIPFSDEREENNGSEEKTDETENVDYWEKGDSASYVIGGVPVAMTIVR